MYRGEKWNSFRHSEQWKDIEEDQAKMCDVEYFLENSKPVEKVKSKEKK